MNQFQRRAIRIGIWLLIGLHSPLGRAQALDSPRLSLPFDNGWRFALGHATDAPKDFDYATIPFFFAKAGYGDGPASPNFDDRTWRLVDVPHDWAVDLPFDPRGDGNHGSKAIGRNFPENSVGWYRKTFTLPKEAEGRRVGVEFDGVYRDAAIWLNGFYIGTEPSGYDSFHFDLTDYLHYGGVNVLVVRADATREEGWFYEGAGIYRHVWLTETAPLHVEHDGTFVTTTVTDPLAAHPDATITAQVTVRNDGQQSADFTVDEQVEDAEGRVLAASPPAAATLTAAAANELSVTLAVHDAHLWSLESPYLHTLVTTIRQNGIIVDRYETPFGIRVIRWDPDHGFFLNGKHVEIQGTNLHQDHAGVGVAVPDDLFAYRVARLKEMGSNAIRSSHNPPAPALLAACDRLGMLVLDENRMMGTTPEAEEQLRSMIVRDRNHPSVILWSVGNEEWDLEWSIFGERLTRDTQAYAHRLDPTRPATVALSGSGAGNSLSSEVLGFNYYVQHNIDAMHARFPTRPIVGTEESSSEHTRGTYFDDPAHQHLVAYDYEADGKHVSIEDAWRYHLARPFSAGLFYWTGFDYRGETTPFEWPAISSQFGMLDTCGFFKDNAYLLQSWWTTKPMVHVLPHWSWPGREGQPIDVRVSSNAASVELLLNGKSLGRKPMPPNSHLEWKVAYTPGALVARAYDTAGTLIATDTEETTGAPAKLELLADRSRIAANGAAVAIITARVTDVQGRLVPDAANLARFTIEGPGRILGVGNGDPASHEPDQSIEQVRTVPVFDWRTRPANTMQPGQESRPEFDDSAWEKARDPRWDEHRVDPPMSIYRGSFALTPDELRATIRLAWRSMGESQSIYLNGHLLGSYRMQPAPADTKPGSGGTMDIAGDVATLDPAILKAGNNSIVVYTTRFSPVDKKLQAFHWNGPGPAAIQVTEPEPPWQRSVFHGLAQVIVQSTGPPGEIRLSAAAPGLAGAMVQVNAGAVQP